MKNLTPAITLVTLIVLMWVSPTAPIDPWNLISLKKVATMILALTSIQVIGSALTRLLGVREGAIIGGFLGGLISSTATTAALAKRSKVSSQKDVSTEVLTFLSATAAMLFEGVALLLTGTSGIHFSLTLIFLGPILTTAGLIYLHSRKLEPRTISLESTTFRIWPTLKLAAFIIAILALSKFLQNTFGQYGLIILTFLISLFEIHGSVIANLQLHDSETISVVLLGGLLAISVAASYLSKLFLIYTLGSRPLRIQVVKITSLLFLSLILSWSVFATIIR